MLRMLDVVDYHVIVCFCTLWSQGCISYEWDVAILVYTAIDSNNSIVAAIFCKSIEDNVLAVRSLHRKGG